MSKKIVLFLLKRMAKRRLRKFRGKIIAVTGSVGKTSTKDAIYTVLNSRFKVKRSRKSMNSDFGLLLTILDIESGYKSAIKWSWYLTKGFWNSFKKMYSEVLLLELGVDKPGDMDYLRSVIKPDIAVFTNVHKVHIAEGQFKDEAAIFAEKSKMLKGAEAIVNADNEFTAKIKGVTFGAGESDFRATQISQSVGGIGFVLEHKGKKYEVASPVLGKYQIYNLLPAIACGEMLGMEMSQIIDAVGRYELPPGRMGVIEGRNGSTLLDSTYNSSPAALKEALKVLKDVGEKYRKVAILGNMNELGPDSAELHKGLEKTVVDCCDKLITVGEDAKNFGEGDNYKSVGQVEFEPKKGDVILLKGSQNKVRLEKLVKRLMEHPEDAKDLLVRQETAWNEI